MSKFQFDIFEEQVKSFYKVKKRVLQSRPLSTNKTKLEEYVNSLIETYNSILAYTKNFYEELSEEIKGKVRSILVRCRELLIQCFGRLCCRIHVPHEIELFEFIINTTLTDSESCSEICESDEELIIEKGNNISTKLIMASIAEKKVFLNMCATMLRDNYDGNPLTLESFLDKIELIEELTEPNLESTLISFVKSKLEAKAREVLPDKISSVEEIKIALKTGIKPDNSKVIAGKIAALTVRNSNYADFSKQAEDLADALKRSLILEGITKTKAHEMAIEQTVSVCRLNAKSTLVKSILASSTFSDPKEVVAKLVVEQTNEVKEQQVLSFRAHSKNKNTNYRNQNNSYRGQYNGYRNNYSRGNNRRNANTQNYRNANNNSTSGGNYRNNYRGNSRSSSYNNNNQRASVRALNSEAPQQATLGEAEQI